MAHDIELLETVYERMHQAGFIQSKVEFSTRMLGKGPSYLTSMSARDRNVPAEVITHLLQRIDCDITEMDVQAAEFEERLRLCKLEQAHRRELLGLIAEGDRLGKPAGNSGVSARQHRLVARLLNAVRKKSTPQPSS